MRSGVTLLIVSLSLLLLLPACGGGGAYDVTVISRNAAGKITETGRSGRATGKHSAVTVTLGSEPATVVCNGARSNGGSFRITWPGGAREDVIVEVGKPSDHFYMGGDLGVRIRLQAKP